MLAIWKNIPMDRDKIRKAVDELVAIAQAQDYDEIVKKIKELIPEYIGDNHRNNEINES